MATELNNFRTLPAGITGTKEGSHDRQIKSISGAGKGNRLQAMRERPGRSGMGKATDPSVRNGGNSKRLKEDYNVLDILQRNEKRRIY